MLAYQQGDTHAFDSLYARHKDGLFAFLYRSCQRQAIVEELAQDAWIGVIKSASSYKPEARFKTWLYQIAHNRMIDYWRRRDNQHDSLSDVPEPATDADASEESTALLMAAIAQLPREQCNTLLLQQQGFSLRDIAQITDCAEETAKSRLRYARTQLRDALRHER